jgi:hypothetical protein
MRFLIIFLLTCSVSFAAVKDKKKVTQLINHPFVEKVHALMIKKALERLEEFDQKNFEKMKKLVAKKFDFNKLKYSLVDEVAYIYSEKEFKEVYEYINKPFFNKFYKLMLNLEELKELDKDAQIYLDGIQVEKKSNEYRELYSGKVVSKINRLFTHMNLIKTLSRVIFTEYNKRINMKALDALEQSIFFYNLEEKEKIRNKNIREKHLYYVTRRDVLSDLVEYDRIIQFDPFQKFVLKLLDYYNYYYSSVAEDMGLREDKK